MVNSSSDDRRHQHQRDQDAHRPRPGQVPPDPGVHQAFTLVRSSRAGGPSAFGRRLLTGGRRRSAAGCDAQRGLQVVRVSSAWVGWRAGLPGTGSRTQTDVGGTILVPVDDVGEPACCGSRPRRGRRLAHPVEVARTARRWWPGGRRPRSCRPARAARSSGSARRRVARSGSATPCDDRHASSSCRAAGCAGTRSPCRATGGTAACRAGDRRGRVVALACPSRSRSVGHLGLSAGRPRSWSRTAGRRRRAAPRAPAVMSSSPRPRTAARTSRRHPGVQQVERPVVARQPGTGVARAVW